MEEKSLILSNAQVEQKIKRIAYEIYENNFKEKEIILAGIYDQGYAFAALLSKELEAISTFKVNLIGVHLDKEAPTQSEISLTCEQSELRNKSVILIDDVSNTGRTLAYSLKPFLSIKVKKIAVAVLVNRSHTQFPISIQYTGYELSTSIMEHVEVQLKNEEKVVYLL